jgi:DNA (cytosine-5)-methyltransferase 1
LNVGSLFSGVGGIELGFDRAGGFSTNWFVECEPYAQAILRKRFPDAIIYDDVTKIDFRSVPKVDVLTGGFPCQDISNAGKRVGIEGSRSSLWKYYVEAIRVLRPKYALIENVSALIGRGLDVVLADLAQIGYDAEWHCISASCVGAPHRRDRVFVIGVRTVNVAYSCRVGNKASMGQEECERNDEKCSCSEPARAGDDVAYASADGFQGGCAYEGGLVGCCEERRVFQSAGGNIQADVSDCDRQGLQGEKSEAGSFARRGWWAVEPDVGRVVDGVSFRVDRIKCLGNAVVPQCAEIFAKAIKEVQK